LEIIEDDHVFRLLGLRDEEEKTEKTRKDAGVKDCSQQKTAANKIPARKRAPKRLKIN